MRGALKLRSTSKMYDRERAPADIEKEIAKSRDTLEYRLFSDICMTRELEGLAALIRSKLIPVGWPAKILQFRKPCLEVSASPPHATRFTASSPCRGVEISDHRGIQAETALCEGHPPRYPLT